MGVVHQLGIWSYSFLEKQGPCGRTSGTQGLAPLAALSERDTREEGEAAAPQRELQPFGGSKEGLRRGQGPCRAGQGQVWKEAPLSKESLLYTKGSALASVPATQLFSPCRSAQNMPGPSPSPREGQFLPLRVYNLAKLK